MENMDKTSSAPKSYTTLLIHKDLIIDLLQNNNYIMIEASRLAPLFPAFIITLQSFNFLRFLFGNREVQPKSIR